MQKKHVVRLGESEQEALKGIVSKGKHSAQEIRRAHTLLMSAEGKTDEEIAEALRISAQTVYWTRRRWAEVGQAALKDKPKGSRRRKLDGKQEAFLVALVCSEAPEGRERWTLQLLADKLLELKVVDEPISYETVRDRLKKTSLSRGKRSSGASRPR
jgi:transposase